MVQDYEQAEQAVAEHQRVRDDEDPVRDEPAVDSEPERRGYLADEEPLRDALAGTLLPLLVDLLRDGQHQNPGADPADRFRPHSIPLVTNFCRVISTGRAREQPPHGRAQSVRVERLRLEGVRALTQRDASAPGAEARGDEYRRRGYLGRRAHAAYEVEAVGRRHPNVRDDEVGPLLQRQLEAERAVIRNEDAVPVALKRHTHELALNVVVLDHKNLLHAPDSSSQTARR